MKLVKDKLIDNVPFTHAVASSWNHVFMYCCLCAVPIKDLLRDPAGFQAYMVSTLSLDPDVAEAIVEGGLSMEVVGTVIQRCDPFNS